jgi:hypothetical protein
VSPGRMAAELETVLERQVAAEQHAAAVEAVDWGAYRACRVCRVELGRPCRSASGRVVDGRPDGIATELEHPHVARERRTGR